MYLRNGNTIIKTDRPELFADWQRLSQREGKRLLADKGRNTLRGLLSPGDTVYTILRRVARSGMSRRIDFYIIYANEPIRISYEIGHVLGWPVYHDGVRVDGCGMDAGFHAVHSLGCELWPNGTAEPHGTRNGRPDHDGGYALRHAWL